MSSSSALKFIKATQNNKELKEKLEQQVVENSNLKATNSLLQNDQKNYIADDASLNAKSSSQNLELKEQLRLERSKSREMSMESAILKDELNDTEQNI